MEGDTVGTGLNIYINFNDFLNSLMVLFALLVSNNWNSMVDLYCYATSSTFWPRFYFGSYFFLVALLFINIIISFVMEIYGSLGADTEQ